MRNKEHRQEKLVNEPIWYSVNPTEATGDVPVYQQCRIDTMITVMHAAMYNAQEILLYLQQCISLFRLMEYNFS